MREKGKEELLLLGLKLYKSFLSIRLEFSTVSPIIMWTTKTFFDSCQRIRFIHNGYLILSENFTQVQPHFR